MNSLAQFDFETRMRLDRIRQFTNPRSFRGRLRRMAEFLRNMDRAAAVDSLRNVLAIIGGAAVLAYLGTMPPLLIPVGVVIFVTVFWLDYLRHF